MSDRRYEKILEAIVDALESLGNRLGSSADEIKNHMVERILKKGRRPKATITALINITLRKAVADKMLELKKGRFLIPSRFLSPSEDDLASTLKSEPVQKAARNSARNTKFCFGSQFRGNKRKSRKRKSKRRGSSSRRKRRRRRKR